MHQCKIWMHKYVKNVKIWKIIRGDSTGVKPTDRLSKAFASRISLSQITPICHDVVVIELWQSIVQWFWSWIIPPNVSRLDNE